MLQVDGRSNWVIYTDYTASLSELGYLALALSLLCDVGTWISHACCLSFAIPDVMGRIPLIAFVFAIAMFFFSMVIK